MFRHRLASLTHASIVRSLVPLVLGSAAVAQAPASHGGVHPTPPPTATAVERRGQIAVDGRLDEAAWAAATPVTEFRQVDPHEGAPNTQRTEVRFVYDDDALYVGARMYDSLGAAGVSRRLARHDQGQDADWFQLVLDTYHDHLGRAFFQVNPSGVKFDALGVGLSNPDPSWEPIWEAATSVDSLGWTAEYRIPFSQLRFSRSTNQVWGLQIRRFVNRLNEQDEWAFWTKQEAGGPSRFGHLEGLRIGARPRHLELLPYVVGRSQHVLPTAGDPFHDRSENSYRVGGDVKALLTSNLTLDATVNPDFGQVEVDPAVVNLSAFETFYAERRPFFVEGAGIFDFGGFNCMFCDNVSSLDAFYSRRIGRAPSLAGYVRGNYEYSDLPDASTILAAAKVTGRTARGYTVGLLDAVTRDEFALAANPGTASSRIEVEPRTNYMVARARGDYHDGNVVVGGIATSVDRRLDDPLLVSSMARHAEVVGSDFAWSWDNKRSSIIASGLVSNVAGSVDAIAAKQNSSARYFRRPDRTAGGNGLFSNAYDPNATDLRGYGYYARLAKDAGTLLYELMTNVRSPGFETNDLSFLTRADYRYYNANVGFNLTQPTRYYRNLVGITGGQEQFNYSGDRSNIDEHLYLGAQFPNYWFGNMIYIFDPIVLDDRLTRGGPSVRRTGYHFMRTNISTDSRKSLVLRTSSGFARTVGDEGGTLILNVDALIKPWSNVSLEFGPSYDHDVTSRQYVQRVDAPASLGFYGSRYVFATIDQHTLSLDTRLSVTFTPTLTLELFAQPFIASGDYRDFKEYVRPRELATRKYAPSEIQTYRDTRRGIDTLYHITPADGGPAFDIYNPDFNARSLRGNAVLRWEYRPGSTIFFVWTQSRNDEAPQGDFDFGRDRAALFRSHADNIFQLKMNYWIGR